MFSFPPSIPLTAELIFRKKMIVAKTWKPLTIWPIFCDSVTSTISIKQHITYGITNYKNRQ